MARSSRLRRLAPLVLSLAGCLGLFAAPASASTAALVDVPGPPCKFEPCPGPETALLYQGGGERNRVTLTAVAGDGVRINDRGATIQPGRGCSRVDDHRVICSPPSTSLLKTPIFVATGGGADRVVSGLEEFALSVDGGPGDDVLVGGSSPDWLSGGTGSDRLHGRGRDDRLYDASPVGNAQFDPFGSRVPRLPSGRGRDSYDGGSGRDTVSYEGRSEGVSVDLSRAAPVAGARRERDSIRHVENAVGGTGNDRLAGNGGFNRLEGLAGRDRISGRRGADILNGGGGRDVVSAGSGNDRIYSDGVAGPDRTICGPGTKDLLLYVYPGDFLGPDCESPVLVLSNEALLAAPFGAGALLPLQLRSFLPLRRGRPPRILSGTVSCFPNLVCQARVELRVHGPGSRGGSAPAPGTLLGSQHLTIAGEERRSVDLRLSSAGLRILRRHRALRVRVIVATQFSGSDPAGYVTLLRAP